MALMTRRQARRSCMNSSLPAGAISAGRQLVSDLPSSINSASELLAIAHPIAISPKAGGRRTPSFEIEAAALAATKADNSTATLIIHKIDLIDPAGDFGAALADDTEISVTPLVSVALTYSTAVGATGGVVVTSGERLADTMVLTDKLSAALGTAFGLAAAVYSPADNTPARLILPEVGSGGLLVAEVDHANGVIVIAEYV